MSASLSIQLPGLTPAVPLRAAPVARAPAGDFMAALGTMLLPGMVTKGEGERQLPAESGKDLPDEDGVDPVMAWLPEGTAPLPIPVTLGLSLKASAPPTVEVEGVAAPALSADPVPATLVAVEPTGETAIETAPIELDAPVVIADPDKAVERTAKVDMPARDRIELSTPRPAILQPKFVQLQSQSPIATTTAAQAFAVAIAAPTGDPVTTLTGDVIPITASAQAADQLRTTVQAMSATDQAPLDLSRDDWPNAMIDRIAAMRDAAEAADTRIRLAPENLGALEISIRRDGDRMHVHFTAEQPATRQLLADAASQLIELANARGVKLGGSSVDSGTGGQPGTPRQPEPVLSARPASATGGAETDPNERIA